jgi:hypothetical protein
VKVTDTLVGLEAVGEEAGVDEKRAGGVLESVKPRSKFFGLINVKVRVMGTPEGMYPVAEYAFEKTADLTKTSDIPAATRALVSSRKERGDEHPAARSPRNSRIAEFVRMWERPRKPQDRSMPWASNPYANDLFRPFSILVDFLST